MVQPTNTSTLKRKIFVVYTQNNKAVQISALLFSNTAHGQSKFQRFGGRGGAKYGGLRSKKEKIVYYESDEKGRKKRIWGFSVNWIVKS